MKSCKCRWVSEDLKLTPSAAIFFADLLLERSEKTFLLSGFGGGKTAKIVQSVNSFTLL